MSRWSFKVITSLAKLVRPLQPGHLHQLEEQVCSCTSQAVSEPFVEEMGWEEIPTTTSLTAQSGMLSASSVCRKREEYRQTG